VRTRTHARTPSPLPFFFPFFIAFLSGLFFFWSPYSKTAMALALLRPAVVEKLVVVDIAPVYYKMREAVEIGQHIAALPLDTITTGKEADAALAQSKIDPGLRQFLLQNLTFVGADKKPEWRCNVTSINHNMETLGAFFDVDPPPPAFQKPVLFIRGDKSTYVPTDSEPLIKQLFPTATIKTISNAGHWVHADNPKEFIESLREFITCHSLPPHTS
jgi:pimeloyl-ACP methyl ester carboxylesterase